MHPQQVEYLPEKYASRLLLEWLILLRVPLRSKGSIACWTLRTHKTLYMAYLNGLVEEQHKVPARHMPNQRRDRNRGIRPAVQTA